MEDQARFMPKSMDEEWEELFDLVRNPVKVRQTSPTTSKLWHDSQMELDATKGPEPAFLRLKISDLQPVFVEKDAMRLGYCSPIDYQEHTSDNQVQDRTIFIKIHYEKYPTSCVELDRVFSRIGILEELEIFDSEYEYHSRIRFQTKESTVMAFNAFNGKNIYGDCCELELYLKVPTSHPSSTIVAPVEDLTPESVTSKIEHVQKESFLDEYNLSDEMPMEDESEILQENCSVDLTNASAKVFPPSLTQYVVEITNEAVECDDLLVDSEEMKTDECDSLLSSAFVEFDYASFSIPNDTLSLGIFNLHSSFSATYGGSKQFEVVVLELLLVNARELLEKMSKKDVVDLDDFVELPSILEDLLVSIDCPSSYVFDPGTSNTFSFHIERIAKKLNYGVVQGNANSHVEGVLRETCRGVGSLVFVFDPGGGLA